MPKIPALRLLLAITGLLLAGCSPWVRLEQPMAGSATPLLPGTSLGQTFTAHEDGLNGIWIHLQPSSPLQGSLQLRLKKSPQDSEFLASASIPLAQIEQPGWQRFIFAPIPNSARQDYYFSLRLDGSGELSLTTAPGDAYLNGALYQNDQPADAQTTFRLQYDPKLGTIGLLHEAVRWLLYLLAGVWLCTVPGMGILAVLYPAWQERNWVEKFALSTGVGLAISPLLMLWTHLIGLNLNRYYVWLPGVAGALLLLVSYLRRRHPKSLNPIGTVESGVLPNLSLAASVAVLIFSRFWVIRKLDYPMWGDSLQHTMIAQLIVDHGGLFNSWQPYAELQSFTYHFGFHTLVAAFHWIAGLSLPLATLWVGQLVNLAAILTLIPLATRLGKTRWAGVFVILIAGLLSPMPQAYVNWGRYTQLAGQAILPVIVYIGLRYQDNRDLDRRLIVLLSLLLGGLALTHYRVLLFAGVFFVAEFLFRSRQTHGWKALARVGWIGAGGLILFLPWLINLFAGGIPKIALTQLSTPVSQISDFARQYNAISNLGAYLPPILWMLMLVCAAWAFWRHEIEASLVALWWFLILLAANPLWFNLPGSGLINNFAVFIAAYIPAGLLIASAAGWTIQGASYATRGRGWLNQVIYPIALLIALALSIIGARWRLRDLNPHGGVLFTRPDQRASEWIKANTPKEARFLVNAFFAYGDWVIVGCDGGWWLPLTAQRTTTLPPINYGNEQGPSPGYRKSINALQRLILDNGIDHPDVHRGLIHAGVSYVYIGQRHGRVNNPGPSLDPVILAASPAFKLVYHQDRVYIFQFQPSP